MWKDIVGFLAGNVFNFVNFSTVIWSKYVLLRIENLHAFENYRNISFIIRISFKQFNIFFYFIYFRNIKKRVHYHSRRRIGLKPDYWIERAD